MKKLVIVLLLGLLIAGSVSAQWVFGYNPAIQTMQTITGTLQMINGMLAIVSGNQVYYVPSLQPYCGVYGMYINTNIAVHGIITNNYCEPLSFMVYGTWYTLPVYVYYYTPQYRQMYMPFSPLWGYPNRFGLWGSW